MIRLDQVSVTYPDAAGPALREVDLTVEEGELCLVVGRTGAGKSTLLGTVNGLVPHFTGGLLTGRVTVAGRDTRTHPPRELADVVGYVGQDPLAGFVTDTVEEELAYAMEQLAVAPDAMRKRVEETLDLLGLADLRYRALADLSAGQQQRVAIGSVLTAHPAALVLDEPTSALDPGGAEDVLAAITRLVHDLGVTVLLAEHRLERVVQYADRVVEVGTDGRVSSGVPAEVLEHAPVAPPVVELGRWAGWRPLPLSVRDARRRAAPLRDELRAASAGAGRDGAGEDGAGRDGAEKARSKLAGSVPAGSASEGGHRNGADPAPGTGPALRAEGVVVRHGPVVAVRGVDLDLHGGEVVALMGRNGAGKSSLLWALQGSGPRQAGRVAVAGHDPARRGAAGARRLVGLVPQVPADLLYLDTVAAETRQADRESGAVAGSAAALLERLSPGVPPDRHPRDLSEGQRLALVLAVQLVAAPSVVLLDEPTRGLDYPGKRQLADVLAGLARRRTAVVVATHDVEFAALVAHRVVVLAEGEVVADGPAADVVTSSPLFAPQVAKVLGGPWLTVDEVRAAVAR